MSGGKSKSKPIQNDGVRQRKTGNGDGDGDSKRSENRKAPPTARSPVSSKPAPSSGGMTCLNWFFVLFFILGSCAITFFFIHNELTVTRRLLQKELLKLQHESPGNLKNQIQEISADLKSVKQLQEDLASVKENEEAKAAELKQLSGGIEKSQQSVKDLTKQFTISMKVVANMQKSMEAMKETMSKPHQSDESSKAELQKIRDLLAVADTNTKYLSDEVIRVDKRLTDQFTQTNSIQKEVIDLTADKVQMNSAIESIKSTVVSVRDAVHNLPEGATSGGDSGAFDEKLQKLDAKTSSAIEKLTNQISEQSENSAKWLQEASNELEDAYSSHMKPLVKELEDLKEQVGEPQQGTEDGSSFDSKLKHLTETQEKYFIDFLKFKTELGNQEKNEDKDYESLRESVIKLTSQVMSVKGSEGQLEELVKTVTSLRNELNGVKSIARILESRLEEVREKTKITEGVKSQDGANK